MDSSPPLLHKKPPWKISALTGLRNMLQHGFNQDDNVWNVNVMFENLTVRKSNYFLLLLDIIIIYLITICYYYCRLQHYFFTG